MTFEGKFRFLSPFIPEEPLIKSRAGKEYLPASDEDINNPDFRPEDFIIKGRFLHQVKDAQGEIPIVPEMDYSYFMKHGWIKYEHDPIVTVVEKGKKIQQIPVFDPENHIGVPLEVKIGDTEAHLTAALFPGMKKAQGLVRLMKEVAKHNQRFPEAQRHLQFSIEGGYISKSKDGRYRGYVINTVVTPSAQDATTFAKLASEYNTQMVKSMVAGYAANPEEMKDGAALRREDIDESPKSTTTKDRKMKKKEHRNLQAAFEHNVQVAKMEKSAAAKAAKDYFVGYFNERGKVVEEIKKNIDAAIAEVDSEVTALDKFDRELRTRADEIEELDVSLKKSIRALISEDDVNQLDAGKFMSEVVRTNIHTATMVHTGLNALQKSVATILKAQRQILDFQKTLADEIDDLAKDTQGISDEVSFIRAGVLSKARSAVPADQLPHNITIQQVSNGENDELPEAIAKSIGPAAIENFLVEKAGAATDLNVKTAYLRDHETFRKARAMARTAGQGNPTIAGLAALSKSRQQEIAVSFGISLGTN